MAEPTLNLSMDELQAEAGYRLGWGRGPEFGEKAWDDRKKEEIRRVLDSALRMFYQPSPLPGETVSYDWSFLRPFKSLTLTSGTDQVSMPDDFGGLEGPVTLYGSNGAPIPVRQYQEQVIRQKQFEDPDATGQPLMLALQVRRGSKGMQSTRSLFFVWPIADQDYTLHFQYYLNPNAFTSVNQYAYGGATHAETLKAAVGAAIELYQNRGGKGPMHEYFVDRMRASISLDRRNKAQIFGYNGDPGYNRPRGRRWQNDLDGSIVTVNGVTPT